MNSVHQKPRISAIAAIGAQTRALGKSGKLLWRIPEDLKRVKTLTMGHPLIMGRKTYESIGGALPGRTMIVISRDETYEAPGCEVVHSLKEAFERAKMKDPEECFIFGGEGVYQEALSFTHRLYLTLVDDDAPGDVFFPDYSEFSKVIERREGEHGGLHYTFLTLERP